VFFFRVYLPYIVTLKSNNYVEYIYLNSIIIHMSQPFAVGLNLLLLLQIEPVPEIVHCDGSELDNGSHLMGSWRPRIFLVCHRSWKYSSRSTYFHYICVETKGTSYPCEKILSVLCQPIRISVPQQHKISADRVTHVLLQLHNYNVSIRS